MICDQTLTTLNILIAFIGVLFVGITIYEYWKLRTIRKDFARFRKELADAQFRSQKASHRVFASYSAPDADLKISLLQSALEIDPTVFNAYNSLGYAWLEKNEVLRAIQAFNLAIEKHPHEKAGYFDLASVYLMEGSTGLCLENLEKAVVVDPTSRNDLKDNPQFAKVAEHPRYRALLQTEE